ncbi:ABC-type transporter Mla maintaining outer membrane lipid asymmetry ATPase subunit MlaF [Rubellimicrobium aerolatum]|nr:ABC-type transporter Mla maintaining outer membrane lipid asymmetry ATPase subunit MlaF [Rubellimicrobium aerolatum]
MQKRAALARAIAASPAAILFDEPTAGLDPILAGVINRLIREAMTGLGATAITITHDMTTVRTVADRVALLHGGRFRWTGHAADLARSGAPYIENFTHGRAEGPIATLR